MCHKRMCTIHTVLYSEFQRAVDGLKQGAKDSGQTHILEGPFLVLTESRRESFQSSYDPCKSSGAETK